MSTYNVLEQKNPNLVIHKLIELDRVILNPSLVFLLHTLCVLTHTTPHLTTYYYSPAPFHSVSFVPSSSAHTRGRGR